MRAAVPVRQNWREFVKPTFHEKLGDCTMDDAFMHAKTFREQCFYVFHRFPEVPDYQLAKFFGIDKGSVSFQRQRFTVPAKKHGRPSILTDEQVASVSEYVEERLAHSSPPTCNDVLNFIYENFGISILPDTFRHWINRKTNFATANAAPMEEKRLSVTGDQILAYYEALKRATEGVPAALVMNLDESGFQKFADARNETVITRKGCCHPKHPVSRAEKRATFLAAITASGNFLKPLMIVPRSTIECDLIVSGYDSEKVVFASSPEGYITKELFMKYIEHIVLPYVRWTRKSTGYNGHAVLIMDGCSCHRDPALDQVFDENGVIVVFMPAHSSDQLQPLDVGIFGNLKQAQSRIHTPSHMTLQTQQVIRALAAFQAVAHPYAVTSAFRKAGISPVCRNGKVYVAVTPWTAKYLRGVPEEYLHPPDGFEACDQTRINLRNRDWGPRQDELLDEAGYPRYSGEMPDLPFVPSCLCPDYKSTLTTEFADLLTGFVESDDDSDYVDTPEDDDPEEGAECEHEFVGDGSRAQVPLNGSACCPPPPIQANLPPFPVLQPSTPPMPGTNVSPFTFAVPQWPHLMFTAPQPSVSSHGPPLQWKRPDS